jgi:hypothetical protein
MKTERGRFVTFFHSSSLVSRGCPRVSEGSGNDLSEVVAAAELRGDISFPSRHWLCAEMAAGLPAGRGGLAEWDQRQPGAQIGGPLALILTPPPLAD